MRKILPLLFVGLLAVCAATAEDSPASRHDAVKQLADDARQGDAKALYYLATFHDKGYDTILVDSLRSTALYRLSAEKGYSPAMNYLGFRYFTGEAVRKDIDSAIFWIRKAADMGDITAAANLGYLLADSPEITHDIDEAAKWLTIASEAGVKEAQIRLGEIKEDEWRMLPPDSALNLGLKFYSGNAHILGVKLLEKAANQNNAKALALLGDAYSKGRGLPYDYQKSIEYFYRAAILGDPSAQFIIAELIDFFPDAIPLLDDSFINQSELSSPQYWYEKAASKGIVDSKTAYDTLFSPI